MPRTQKLSTEDTIFSRARLGRHWTPERARQCVNFFPVTYRFTRSLEILFRKNHLTDYNEHLLGLLEKGPQ